RRHAPRSGATELVPSQAPSPAERAASLESLATARRRCARSERVGTGSLGNAPCQCARCAAGPRSTFGDLGRCVGLHLRSLLVRHESLDRPCQRKSVVVSAVGARHAGRDRGSSGAPELDHGGQKAESTPGLGQRHRVAAESAAGIRPGQLDVPGILCPAMGHAGAGFGPLVTGASPRTKARRPAECPISDPKSTGLTCRRVPLRAGFSTYLRVWLNNSRGPCVRTEAPQTAKALAFGNI